MGWSRETLEQFWPMELPPMQEEVLNEHLEPRYPSYPERLDAVRDPLYREGRSFSQLMTAPTFDTTQSIDKRIHTASKE